MSRFLKQQQKCARNVFIFYCDSLIWNQKNWYFTNQGGQTHSNYYTIHHPQLRIKSAKITFCAYFCRGWGNPLICYVIDTRYDIQDVWEHTFVFAKLSSSQVQVQSNWELRLVLISVWHHPPGQVYLSRLRSWNLVWKLYWINLGLQNLTSY